MGKYYRIKNLSKALDGLVVYGSARDDGEGGTVRVDKIICADTVVGDRNAKYPVAESMEADPGLLIGEKYLEQISGFEEREFDSGNPYGKFLFEGSYAVGDIEVAFSQHESCLQVSILEKQKTKSGTTTKTKFSDNFLDPTAFGSIRECISDCVADGKIDELVFSLDAWRK